MRDPSIVRIYVRAERGVTVSQRTRKGTSALSSRAMDEDKKGQVRGSSLSKILAPALLLGNKRESRLRGQDGGRWVEAFSPS